MLSPAIRRKLVVLIGVSGLKGSCSGVGKALFFHSVGWKKQQPEPELLPAHQGEQCGIPHQSSLSVCLLLALAGITAKVLSPSSQLIEFKSSRLPCIPPPHTLLSVFCLLAV